ncbi:MAG: ABC transporter permease [Acidimicrobiia bacterium]|nr:ABC transporter permease [Acidimicrobiia bacterium]
MNPDGTFGLSAIPVIVAAVALIGVSVAISWRLRLGVERSILWAAVRATVQLIAVGLLFAIIFESSLAELWAWLWVAVMVGVATYVVQRRAPKMSGVALPAFLAVAGSAVLSIVVIFGFGVLEFEPVRLVVIVGITLGNSLGSAVGGVVQTVSLVRDRPGEIEALLALGANREHVVRYIAPQASKLALVNQIERTKVVGLIALPGAMTGLLLAGVDPFDAVILQLLVMLIVLGSVGVSVLATVLSMASRSVTPELTLAAWASNRDDASA